MGHRKTRIVKVHQILQPVLGCRARAITQQWGNVLSMCQAPGFIPEKEESEPESTSLIFNLNPKIGGNRISSEPRKPTLRTALEGSQGKAGFGPG